MSTTKVTVELPAGLLARARKATGEGITTTIRRGLELVASTRAQEQLRGLRGRVKFSIDGRDSSGPPMKLHRTRNGLITPDG